MVLTLIIAFLCLIALMIIHEFGHFIIAKKFGVRVDEFGIGYPPRLFGRKFGETLYSVNLLPLGAFVRIHGEEGGVDDIRSFSNLKIWKRVLIVLGGVIAFWLAAIVIFSVVFGIGAQIPVGDTDVPGVLTSVRIVEVSPDSPATEAGLRIGDAVTGAYVLSLDSSKQPVEIPIKKIKDFQDFAKQNAGKPALFEILRDGKNIEATVNIRTTAPQGQGLVGVALERMATVIQKAPWYLTPIKGAVYTWQITVASVQGLYMIFASLLSAKGLPQGAEPAGPIGITVLLAQVWNLGAGVFLYFIGLISVSVALFNLFPIPALDGGKLIFLAIEKVRGKAVSVKTEQIITIFFFLLLIALSVFVTVWFDITRLLNFFKQ